MRPAEGWRVCNPVLAAYVQKALCGCHLTHKGSNAAAFKRVRGPSAHKKRQRSGNARKQPPSHSTPLLQLYLSHSTQPRRTATAPSHNATIMYQQHLMCRAVSDVVHSRQGFSHA